MIPAITMAERCHRMSIIDGKIEIRMEQLGRTVVAPLWPERKERLAGMELPELQKLAHELQSVLTIQEFNKNVVSAFCDSEERRRLQ